MTYQIEKGIPHVGSRGRQLGFVDALRQLEIGDSFVASGKYKRSQAYAAARRIGIKVSASEIAPDKFRIWRI